MTALKELEVPDEVPTAPSKIIEALLMSLCNSPFCHTWRWLRAETFETHPDPEGSCHHGVVRHEEVHREEVQQEVIPNDAIETHPEGYSHHGVVRHEEARHEEVHCEEVQQEVIPDDAICTTILLQIVVEGNPQQSGLRKRRKMPQLMTTLRT